MVSGPSYVVHVSGRGNVFMREIAQLVVAALTDLGRDAELRADAVPVAQPGQIDLVVAPHEYFTLADLSHGERRAAARRSICIGTEQPGTPWFELSAAWAAAGPVALDINPLAVRALRRRGVDAHLLRLGYHESWDHWTGRDGVDRSTDILFMGAETKRRSELLSSFGAALSRHECDLRLFGFEDPVDGSTPAFLAGAAKLERLATAKVLLNIHRSEVPYFEWMRALEAIANGCVLVTEPAEGMAPLVASEHVVVSTAPRLIAEVEALLDDPTRRAAMADAAHALVRRELHMTHLLEAQLPAVEQAAARSRESRLPDVRFAVGNTARRGARVARAVAVRGRDSMLARLRGDPLAEGDVDPVRLAHQVKLATLANRRVERRLEALEAERRFGDPCHAEVRTTTAYADVDPDITVVIPLFDYEREVVTAIESVIASRGVQVELLVVDDHSRDRSREVAEQCLDDHDDFPMAVIAKQANAGLSAARNTGFERARADRVFLLDADNAVYPDGLARLSRALDDDPAAAFAYGIIERYGDERTLTSALPWDPARLTRGNYIDAMALIRVDAWRKVGGYDPEVDGRFGGWEDYELWLHLASLGLHGTHVRQVVAKYHSHTGSMLSLLNLETVTVTREFQSRYPDLPWPPGPL